MSGPDHKISLNPKEFKLMVKSIRNVELSFGNGKKTPTKSELKNIVSIRKSIYATQKINKGDILNINNITTKRPLSKMSAMDWDKILNKKSKNNYEIDSPLDE